MAGGDDKAAEGMSLRAYLSRLATRVLIRRAGGTRDESEGGAVRDERLQPPTPAEEREPDAEMDRRLCDPAVVP